MEVLCGTDRGQKHIQQSCTRFTNELPPLPSFLLNKEGYITAAEPGGYKDNVHVTMLSFHCWRKCRYSIKTDKQKTILLVGVCVCGCLCVCFVLFVCFVVWSFVCFVWCFVCCFFFFPSSSPPMLICSLLEGNTAIPW